MSSPSSHPLRDLRLRRGDSLSSSLSKLSTLSAAGRTGSLTNYNTAPLRGKFRDLAADAEAKAEKKMPQGTLTAPQVSRLIATRDLRRAIGHLESLRRKTGAVVDEIVARETRPGTLGAGAGGYFPERGVLGVAEVKALEVLGESEGVDEEGVAREGVDYDEGVDGLQRPALERGMYASESGLAYPRRALSDLTAQSIAFLSSHSTGQHQPPPSPRTTGPDPRSQTSGAPARRSAVAAYEAQREQRRRRAVNALDVDPDHTARVRTSGPRSARTASDRSNTLPPDMAALAERLSSTTAALSLSPRKGGERGGGDGVSLDHPLRPVEPIGVFDGSVGERLRVSRLPRRALSLSALPARPGVRTRDAAADVTNTTPRDPGHRGIPGTPRTPLTATASAANVTTTSSGHHRLPSSSSSSSMLAGRQSADFQVLAAAARRSGDLRAEARHLYGLGVVQDNGGRWAAARRTYGRLAQVAEELGDSALISLAHLNLGIAALLAGNPRAAVPAFFRYLEMPPDVVDDVIGRCNLALCFRRMGAADLAAHHYQCALASENLRSPELETEILRAMAEVAAESGRWESADLASERRSLVARATGDTESAAAAEQTRAAAACHHGQWPEAERRFRDALALSTSADTVARAKVGVAVASARQRADERMREIGDALREYAGADPERPERDDA